MLVSNGNVSSYSWANFANYFLLCRYKHAMKVELCHWTTDNGRCRKTGEQMYSHAVIGKSWTERFPALNNFLMRAYQSFFSMKFKIYENKPFIKYNNIWYKFRIFENWFHCFIASIYRSSCCATICSLVLNGNIQYISLYQFTKLFYITKSND